MRSKRLATVLALAAFVLSVVATPGLAARLDGASHGGAPLHAVMLPDNEVQDPPVVSDAEGTATVTLNPGQEQVCFSLDMGGFDTAVTGGHIHVGAAGDNGPIVVSFVHPENFIDPDEEEFPEAGCVPADRELIRDILTDPAGYYVNIHTEEFPMGEIRGQLGR